MNKTDGEVNRWDEIGPLISDIEWHANILFLQYGLDELLEPLEKRQNHELHKRSISIGRQIASGIKENVFRQAEITEIHSAYMLNKGWLQSISLEEWTGEHRRLYLVYQLGAGATAFGLFENEQNYSGLALSIE